MWGLLRSAVRHNRVLIDRLHEADRRCDSESVRGLLEELDLNNAGFHVALEELTTTFPPTPSGIPENGGDGLGGLSSLNES
jgi:hypothetical protein